MKIPAAEHCNVQQAVPLPPVAAGKILWASGAVIAVILALQVLPYAGAVTLAALTLWACRNTRCALQATTLSVLLTFANPALVGDQPLIGLLKWVLLFASLGTVLFGCRYQPGKAPKWLGCFVLFMAVAFGLALAVSDNRTLSLLKLASFGVGVTVALLGVRDRRYPSQYWLSWFTTVAVVFFVLSAPLEFVSAGRSLNGWAFQGILRHPQSYAVYAVPLAVYLTVTFFAESRTNWILLAVTPWAWYSIFASGCRTALLAVALSSIATAASLAAFPRVKRGSRQTVPMLLKICLAGILVSIVLATSTSALSTEFANFIEKGDHNGFGASRVVQVQALLYSINANLLAGVGFGLGPAGVQQETQRDEFTGLPIGAYTEPGFLPLAVMAQVGIIGAVPFTLFLCVLGIPVVKHGEPAVVAMFFTALFVNFGEMIFFSIGGLGLHMWLLIGACLAASAANSGKQKRCA
jgi:hypothetical protein